MTNHEVVAAFLDGEDVNAHSLKRALADPEGRDYLVDLLVLRGSMRATFESQNNVPVRAPKFQRSRLFAAAAGLAIALGSGYLVGSHRQAAFNRENAISPVVVEFSQLATVPAPSPTRVIELKPGLNWKDGERN